MTKQYHTKDLTQKVRFEIDLDFVQSLANPYQIEYLANSGYFKQKSFVHYLKYLLYWKEPEYIKFIEFPACLYYLDKLQDEKFRKGCEDKEVMKAIIYQHECYIACYKLKRTPEIQTPQEIKQTDIQE